MKNIKTPSPNPFTLCAQTWLPGARFFALITLFLSLSEAGATTKGYAYQAGKVFTVNTALGVATQIVIDPDEQVIDFGTGFSAGWDIVRRENILYIKPKDPDAETNMYLKTDKRSYLFDLRLVSKDWKTIEDAKAAGVHYVVQFVYPASSNTAKSSSLRGAPSLSKNECQKIDPVDGPDMRAVGQTGMSFEPDGRKEYHTGYEIAVNGDSRWLVPTRVYDDGKFTYLHFAQGTPATAIFGRSSIRAQEYVVNKTIASDDAVVVHGIHPVIVLRYGNSTVGIRRN